MDEEERDEMRDRQKAKRAKRPPDARDKQEDMQPEGGSYTTTPDAAMPSRWMPGQKEQVVEQLEGPTTQAAMGGRGKAEHGREEQEREQEEAEEARGSTPRTAVPAVGQEQSEQRNQQE